MSAMQMTTVVCFTDLNLNSKVKVVNYMIIFKSLCITFSGKQHFWHWLDDEPQLSGPENQITEHTTIL